MSDQTPHTPAQDQPADPATAETTQQPTEQEGIPPDRWYPDLKSDSTDYLDRDEPSYADGPLFSDEERAAAHPEGNASADHS